MDHEIKEALGKISREERILFLYLKEEITRATSIKVEMARSEVDTLKSQVAIVTGFSNQIQKLSLEINELRSIVKTIQPQHQTMIERYEQLQKRVDVVLPNIERDLEEILQRTKKFVLPIKVNLEPRTELVA